MAKISTKFYTYFLLAMLGLAVLFPLTQATYEGMKGNASNDSREKIMQTLTDAVTDAKQQKDKADKKLNDFNGSRKSPQYLMLKAKSRQAAANLEIANGNLEDYQDSIGTKGPTLPISNMPKL